jgi:hypothetical protein
MITGRIVGTEESTDGRKNIRIIVEFSEDGKVIVPEWVLWAQYGNFLGMTSNEISEWIRINVEYQIGNLIKERVKTALNSEFQMAIEALKEVKIYQTDNVVIPMEANKVILEPYNVTIKADGTVTTDRVAKDG